MSENNRQVLCPHCKADLLDTGIGETYQYHHIEHLDGTTSGGEVGDFIEYYCPECGQTISDNYYDQVFYEEGE